MLLVAAGDNQPKVDVLGSATQLTEALGKFEFSEAQCYDPNEERRMRRAIEAAPGGGAEFQKKVRGLVSTISSAV